MSLDIVYYSSFVVLLVTLLYLKFLSAPDADRITLNYQAQRSPRRLPGETAVFRSMSTPHGRMLLTGLAIGTGFGRTRPGNLSDIWTIGLKSLKLNRVSPRLVIETINSGIYSYYNKKFFD